MLIRKLYLICTGAKGTIAEQMSNSWKRASLQQEVVRNAVEGECRTDERRKDSKGARKTQE